MKTIELNKIRAIYITKICGRTRRHLLLQNNSDINKEKMLDILNKVYLTKKVNYLPNGDISFNFGFKQVYIEVIK